MSVTPVNGGSHPVPPAAASAEEGLRQYRWYHKLIGLLFVILCFEVGVFLLAFPWSQYWTSNYFGWFSPEWHEFWISPYVRGAISGLGCVNLYVSLMEVFRLQRFSAESA